MKILMLTSSFDIGGAETHILTLAAALKKRGHDVTVMSGGGCYVEELRRLEIAHRVLPLKKSTPVAFLLAARRLSLALKKDTPDVIHAHTRNTAFLARIVAKGYGIPIVTTAHLCFSTRFPRKALAYWGERTLAVSEDIGAHLVKEYGLYPDNISLTVNGIDGDSFFLPGRRPAPHSVVSVSRLDRDRSHTATLLIRIAERLYRRFPDFRLTLVGDGSEGERLRKEVEAVNRLCGADIVTFLGRQSDVAPILRRNAVFVGCSRAALEAIASGCLTVLSGDEGYLSVFSEENATEAMKTNFCFRGTHTATEKELYMDISALFCMEEHVKHKRIRFGSEFVKANYGTGRMASDAESVYCAVARPRKGKRAVLLGYYGYGNLGDEATLRAVIGLLRRAGYGRITVLTRTPQATQKREGTHTLFRYAPLRIMLALRTADLFLFGGGTLLQDRTSRRSLLYYDFMSRLARLTKTKFVFFGGIGNLSQSGECRAKAILARADAVYCRTPGDVRAANALGTSAELYPDLAFSYHVSYVAKTENDTFVFCLQDSGDCERYENLLLQIIKIHNIHAVFAVLCEEDAYKAKRMAHMTGGEATPLLTPSALQELFSHACGAIGTRLHFQIFALIMGLPVFALSHDEKGRYFTEYVNEIEKERMAFGHACDEQLGIRLSEFVTEAKKTAKSTSAAEKIKEAAETIPRALLR